MTRDTAMQVPAFRQGVNLIAGTCGAFPVQAVRDNQPLPVQPTILTQPDPDEPVTVTWARLFTDLVLYPYAWLYVSQRDARGFPLRAIHLPAGDVTLGPSDPGNPFARPRVMYRGLDVTADVMRFDNPHAPGALADGCSALSTAIAIETATRRYSVMDIPSGYLRQTGGPDLTAEEIDATLDAWHQARQLRSTAFLGTSVEYQTTVLDPRALQLVEARAANAVDIARLLNLPPMYVNADSGASMTYSNVTQQGQQLLNTTLTPYLAAVAARLSMDDVLPHGTVVVHDMDAWLRSDMPTRMAAYSAALAAGILTLEEVRQAEGLPPQEGAAGAETVA